MFFPHRCSSDHEMTAQKRKYTRDSTHSLSLVTRRPYLGKLQSATHADPVITVSPETTTALRVGCVLPLVTIPQTIPFLRAYPLKGRATLCEGIGQRPCAGRDVLRALGRSDVGLMRFRPAFRPELQANERCLLCHDAETQRTLAAAVFDKSPVDTANIQYRYGDTSKTTDARFPADWLLRAGIMGYFRRHTSRHWRLGIDTITDKAILIRKYLFVHCTISNLLCRISHIPYSNTRTHTRVTPHIHTHIRWWPLAIGRAAAPLLNRPPGHRKLHPQIKSLVESGCAPLLQTAIGR